MSTGEPRRSDRSTAPPAESWTPSRRVTLALVALVAILGVALVVLEAGLAEELVPNYLTTSDAEPSPELVAYADRTGTPLDELTLDPAAVAELERLGINPCAGAVPVHLVPRVPAECGHFDDHGGVAYPSIATGLAGLGAIVFVRWRNQLGLYVILAALTDVAGAAAGAYAIRALVLRPGTLPVGHAPALLGSVTWIVLLVIILPRIVLTFPTGRLVSRHWRWVVRATYVIAASLGVIQLLHPLGVVANPLRASWSVETANSIFDIAIQGWLLVMAAAIVSLLVRTVRWSLRRARARPASVGPPGLEPGTDGL